MPNKKPHTDFSNPAGIQKALIKAIDQNDRILLEEIINKLAKENKINLLNEWAYKGKTPLQYAIKKNNTDLADFLLRNGSNPNLKTKSGFTSLMLAVRNSNYSLVNSLLNANADVSIKYNNKTAFQMACEKNNENISALLALHNQLSKSEREIEFLVGNFNNETSQKLLPHTQFKLNKLIREKEELLLKLKSNKSQNVKTNSNDINEAHIELMALKKLLEKTKTIKNEITKKTSSENVNGIKSKVSQDYSTMNAPIFIKNIFIITKNEFGRQKLEDEKENKPQVKDRIFESIRKYFEIANEKHYEENYLNLSEKKQDSSIPSAPPLWEIKEDRKNHITRLSTQEFSFYPAKEPLSIDEFKSLLKEIQELALSYPSNLHLLLASFPVRDKNGSDYNVSIYVQCGPNNNSMTLIPKATPSSMDPTYENGKLFFYDKTTIRPVEFIKYLAEMKEYLASSMSKNTIPEQESIIRNFLSECASHKNYPISDALTKKFEKVISKLNDGLDEKLLKEIIGEYLQFVHKKSKDESIQAGTDLEKAKLNTFEQVIPGLEEYSVSHVVPSATLGGAQFKTAADICLENAFGVADKNVKRRASNDFTQSKTILPTHFSHVLTSDTTVPSLDSKITNTIEQVDSDETYTGIFIAEKFLDEKNQSKEQLKRRDYPSEQFTIKNLPFGDQSYVRIYQPINVERLVGETSIKIDFANAILSDYSHLERLRQQHPDKRSIYNMTIMSHILNTFKEILSVSRPNFKCDILIMDLIENFRSSNYAKVNHLLPDFLKILTNIQLENDSPLRSVAKVVNSLLSRELANFSEVGLSNNPAASPSITKESIQTIKPQTEILQRVGFFPNKLDENKHMASSADVEVSPKKNSR